MTTTETTTTHTDGRHDFDFWFGQWDGHTRRLADVTDPDCTRWIELKSVSRAWPVLGGLGNIDENRYEGEKSFEGVTFRLYEPATGLWRIWWASSNFPGVLDPPVVGRFADGTGTFEGDDSFHGRPVRVRFIWSDITADSARWTQYFRWSEDGDWVRNWTTSFTRSG